MTRSTIFMVATFLMSATSFAADATSNSDSGLLIPGTELGATAILVNAAAQSQKKIPAVLKGTPTAHHAAENQKLRTEGIMGRRVSVVLAGSLAADAVLRSGQLARGERSANDDTNRYAKALGIGLLANAGAEQAASLRSTGGGSRAVTAASLAGAAILLAGGDREQNDFSLGTAALAASAGQGLLMMKHGPGTPGRVVSPGLGAAMTGVLGLSLIADGVKTHLSKNGEKTSTPAVSAITGEGVKKADSNQGTSSGASDTQALDAR